MDQEITLPACNKNKVSFLQSHTKVQVLEKEGAIGYLRN